MASHVSLLVRGDELTASKAAQEKLLGHPAVTVRFNTEVQRFEGACGNLNRVTFKDRQNGAIESIEPSAVFIFIGLTPKTGLLAGSQVVLDPWGFVITGHALVHDGDRPPGFEGREPGLLETSVPGILAAGDVRAESTKQVAVVLGEGATAALLVREYLKAHSRGRMLVSDFHLEAVNRPTEGGVTSLRLLWFGFGRALIRRLNPCPTQAG